MNPQENPETILEGWSFQWFGWLPLEQVQDPDWCPEDLVLLVNYLQETPIVMFPISGRPLVCSLCGEIIGKNGAIQSDGVFVWPSSLGHRVKKHHVRLPMNFIEHIRNRNYVIREEMLSLEEEDHIEMLQLQIELFLLDQ